MTSREDLPTRRFMLSGGCAIPLSVSDEDLAALVIRYRQP